MVKKDECTFKVMNYLAHAYLSDNRRFVLVGNMISDFVKGRQKLGYTAAIQQGIVLHRNIDCFTDAHPATARAKAFFKPVYRLYSGPIMDVIYDHFLATDATVFTDASLLQFTSGVYQVLEEETIHLPLRFLPVLTYMKMENWLYHYRSPEGVQKSLRGLMRRASMSHDSTAAFAIFQQHYNELKTCYQEFFPAVKQMAKHALDGPSADF